MIVRVNGLSVSTVNSACSRASLVHLVVSNNQTFELPIASLGGKF